MESLRKSRDFASPGVELHGKPVAWFGPWFLFVGNWTQGRHGVLQTKVPPSNCTSLNAEIHSLRSLSPFFSLKSCFPGNSLSNWQALTSGRSSICISSAKRSLDAEKLSHGLEEESRLWLTQLNLPTISGGRGFFGRLFFVFPGLPEDSSMFFPGLEALSNQRKLKKRRVTSSGLIHNRMCGKRRICFALHNMAQMFC